MNDRTVYLIFLGNFTVNLTSFWQTLLVFVIIP